MSFWIDGICKIFLNNRDCNQEACFNPANLFLASSTDSNPLSAFSQIIEESLVLFDGEIIMVCFFISKSQIVMCFY